MFRAAVLTLLLALSVTVARADDDVAAFYKGRNIQVLSAFAQGGRYAMFSRLIATHLPRHLPGRPNGVPQFMPGAAGLLQTNFMYNAAPKDGTAIGLMYDSMPTAQVLESGPNIQYDSRRFAALGSLNKGDAGVAAVLKSSGIATIEDAKRKEVIFAATGVSGGGYTVPLIMNKLFGTRIKVIPGYKTTGEIFIAMDRGEVDGIYGSYESLTEARPDWVSGNRFNWLAQLYDGRAAEFKDAPLLQELATNERDRTALRFLALARIPGKIFIAPPGVPEARLAALRKAFESMLQDSAFKAELAKTQQTLDPRDWQDAERIIRETVDTPPDIIKYVRSLMAITSR